MKKLPWFPLTLALLLAACTMLPGKNYQGAAGITDVRIEFCAVGPVASPTDYRPCLITYRDGKERRNVMLDVNLKEGALSYEVGETLAFDAVRARAAVEVVLIEAQKAGITVTAEMLLKALKMGMVPISGL